LCHCPRYSPDRPDRRVPACPGIAPATPFHTRRLVPATPLATPATPGTAGHLPPPSHAVAAPSAAPAPDLWRPAGPLSDTLRHSPTRSERPPGWLIQPSCHPSALSTDPLTSDPYRMWAMPYIGKICSMGILPMIKSQVQLQTEVLCLFFERTERPRSGRTARRASDLRAATFALWASRDALCWA
jgi:hypothetical protein